MNENADPAAAGQAIIDETNSLVPPDSAKIVGAGGELHIVAFRWQRAECNVHWIYGPG